MDTCTLCVASTYQGAYGMTSCESCTPGFYCREGAAEPTPCPAGTFGNATSLHSAGQCTPVQIDFWAPLGSSLPEPCPSSGFYCPGKAADELFGGSKPIIMPVGQSTRQEEAPALTKTMSLDISLDDFAAGEEELKMQLAARYGIAPALITLEASARRLRTRRALQSGSGGLTLTITIATTDGAGNSVDMDTLTQAVVAVDDTSLATTIGNVTGTTVTVVSQPVEVSTVKVTVAFACPAGSWCTAGLVVPCPDGSYNPLEDQDFATSCVLCPANANTIGAASTSRSSCVCGVEYYDANASQAVDDALIASQTNAGLEPTSLVADVVDCQECPVGTNCDKLGSTIGMLPIARGYYRIDNTTIDVRECPDARANCSTTFGTAVCTTTSGCQGGMGAPEQSCAPGLHGVYCLLCDRSGSNVYYKAASDTAVAHCEECGDTLAQTVLLYSGVAVALVLLLALAFAIQNRLTSATRMRLAGLNATFTPRNKLKILLGFYQITTKIATIYAVALPPDINLLLEQFTIGISFGMEGIATTPMECLGLHGQWFRLLAWILIPPVLLGGVVVLVLISACCGKRQPDKSERGAQKTKAHASDDAHGGGFRIDDATSANAERPPTLFQRTLPAVLAVLFVLYPFVTKVAFDAFPCYPFEDGARGFLIADVEIECNTPQHTAVTTLAWGAILAYPIGIWVFCLLLLFKASPAIIAGKPSRLSKAIAFLYKEYNVTCFWWELMEMGRKFLLVGLYVTVQPGSIMQIAIGTITSATYLMVQLQADPYRNRSDNYLAVASSFGMLMVFFCSTIYKYDALIASEALQQKMSIEQRTDYIVNDVVLSGILSVSVFGALVFAALLLAMQIIIEIKEQVKLRRLKYAANGKWVECKQLSDPQAFHLFLSHAWPAAQDRMRIVKARFLECLPSCKTFLDVDDLKSGSGTAEVDKSECILVFCTSQYFEKKNSLKELYRAVVQRRSILAMLEPDASQEGGLNQADVEALITNAKLDKFKLRKKWGEWRDEGELVSSAFVHAPDEAEVRAALFATTPVEWNRLPHFQDVTIRLIAQNGILHGAGGELYMQGEAASVKIMLPPPLKGRRFHLFCSAFNVGAAGVAEELKNSDVFVTKGKKASAPLTYTTNVDDLKRADVDHMLVLLDDRTWTSNAATAALVEHIHEAMRVGVHVSCVHEFPAVVGPPRHECEFGLMFSDEWTPPHLTSGSTNLYKEIALALKGNEWRKPGLVALASKLASSAGPHMPIEFTVPDSYAPDQEEAMPPDASLPTGAPLLHEEDIDVKLATQLTSCAVPAPAAAPSTATSEALAAPVPDQPADLSDRIKGLFNLGRAFAPARPKVDPMEEQTDADTDQDTEPLTDAVKLPPSATVPTDSIELPPLAAAPFATAPTDSIELPSAAAATGDHTVKALDA